MRRLILTLATASLCACATGARAQTAGSAWPTPPDATADAGQPARDAGADAGPRDPGAEADFQTAARLVNAGDGGARAALEGFIAQHGSHAFRPAATALLVRLLLQKGDLEAAGTRLAAEPDRASDANLRFAAGLLESRRGRPAEAKILLTPFESGGPPPLGGARSEDALVDLMAALGETYAALGDIAAALAAWSKYYESARDGERAFAVEHAEALGARLSPDDALKLFQADARPLVRMALGPRAAAALNARGDAPGARRLQDEVAAQKRAARLDDDAPWVNEGDPFRLGLALPLSGRTQALGAALTRGAMMALGESGSAANGGRPPLLILRNTQDETRGPAAATELSREEAVFGVVGTADARATAELGRDGVPFLVLDEQPPGPTSTAFQLVHTPEARAAALARRAVALGAKALAVLAPDSAAGKRLAEAFKRAATTAGGRIVAEATYVAGTTSFGKPVKDLARTPFEGLFVPEDADRLELIAPALAFADLWSRSDAEITPAGSRPGRTSDGKPAPRGILLLSTARGLSPRLLQNAGRYVQGAQLAPGFYADPQGRTSGRFVAGYLGLYGSAPGAAEAYGYDGVRVLRLLADRGARTRQDALRLLAHESFDGATGTLRFGPDHARADDPALYEVVGDEIRAIR